MNMKPDKQELRRSQFVQVYGPGSIIESPNGSRLIPSFKGLGKDCNDAFFRKNELKDIRMSYILNKDEERYSSHLLEIPSNSSISDPRMKVVYSTVVFPAWHVCYKRNPPVLYYDKIGKDKCDAKMPGICDDCEKEKNPNVRFVRACPNGHLDEVNWKREIHGENSKCRGSKFYYWIVKGSSLSDIIVKCPECDASTNLNEIYNNKRKCTGRSPEKETLKGDKVTYTDPVRPFDCDEVMSVIQKQSSSLRLPVTKTLLKIPKYDEPVIDSFINKDMKNFINNMLYFKNLDEVTEGDLKKGAHDYLPPKDRKKLFEYLENHTPQEYIELYEKAEKITPNFTNAIDEEFKCLRSEEVDLKKSKNFSKSGFYNFTLPGLNYKFPIKACGIDILTTVTAQVSFQRKPHTKKNKKTGEIQESEYVSVAYIDEGSEKKWYPAFKGVGEGIFITSDENPLTYIEGLEEITSLWDSAMLPENQDRPESTKPLFVWWHTLSHAILKSLSLSCGYSAASLHERVYIDNVKGTGGILIYNTSPGDDSGMGGLVDTVYNENEFKRVLKNAMNTILVCSNDPLCSSSTLKQNDVNGSACHNCLLISETSCEHRNSLLDRHFFI